MQRGLFFLLICFVQQVHAQTKYFISFTDKQSVSFNPYTYFDSKAIERRIREGISLFDETDFPVNEDYINTVSNMCDSTRFVSRWLNGMSVYATEEQIAEIKKLLFVKNTQLLQNDAIVFSGENTAMQKSTLSRSELALLNFQTFRHNAAAFTNAGLDGSGIRIAIFDVGFPGVDTHPAFEHIRNEKRIISVYDFIGKDANPYHGYSHGTSCMSCIAGYYDTIAMGMATGAEFLLAKTERMYTEYTSEEDAWLAAAEWADKNGADIISSSLGYTKQRYSPADMDGETSLVAKAAKLASEKGMLVVNAAGNEADGRWQYIATPGDVDEVLTVGGINPYNDAHISFSSFGPTAAYKMKPNVCSLGEAIAANEKKYSSVFGTSFATPLVAGFAACVWQNNKNMKRQEVFDAIQQSGHLYPYFDYAHGYGVPQADYFTTMQHEVSLPTFKAEQKPDEGIISVSIDSLVFPDSVLASESKNFYYNFSDADGRIVFYSVLVPSEISIRIFIPENVMDKNEKYFFTAHFERFTFSTPIN